MKLYYNLRKSPHLFTFTNSRRITFKKKRNTFLKIILYIFLFLSFYQLTAQEYLIDVEFYKPENGLAGRYANCSFKDSRGIFWIGTQFGLSRFDGRNFLNFTEATGLPFNQVMEIKEDSEGWLWLFRNCQLKSNCIRELVFFHSLTHEIHTFKEHFKNELDFLPKDIESIIQNDKGDIFFSAKKKVYQWSEGAIIKETDFSQLKSTPHLISTTKDDKIAAWHHLDRTEDENFVSYFVFDKNGKFTYSKKINSYTEERVNTRIRILGTDEKGRNIIGARQPSNQLNIPRFVVLDNGTLSKDINHSTRFQKNATIHVNPRQPIPFVNLDKSDAPIFSSSLTNDFVQHFLDLESQKTIRHFQFYDDNIVWACGRQGAYLFQIKSSRFDRILYRSYSEQDSTLQSIARGIIPLDNNEFLVTTSNEIHKINLKDRNLNLKISTDKQLVPFALTKGFQDDYWGCRKGKLFRLNKVKGTLKMEVKGLKSQYDFPKVLSQYYVNERLWLGTDKGLHYLDFNKNELFKCEKYNGFEELKELLISHIYEETKDKIWLCTTGGLYLFSPKKGVIKRYWAGGEGAFKLPVSSIYHLQPAREGGWWLAARKGLVYWNPANNEIRHYTVADGLAANEILAVHEDDFGFVWLATNAGLIQFQATTGQSKVWQETDGVSSVDFEPHSYFAQDNGTVWFGTTNGYTVFNTKDFKDIDLNARPNIPINILDYEQFSIKTGQLENWTEDLIFNQKITLRPGERLFNIRVALADYVNGSEAKYAYRIKGVFDLWQEGKENLICISGLPYGKYQLEIRGKLSSGQYSAQEISIPILVFKPLFLRNWFIISAVLVFIGMILFGYLWRVRRLVERQKKLESEVENRTKIITQQAEELKQLDQLKSRFFANVSHELRTPLTLMLAPTNSLLNRTYLSEKDKQLLGYVYKSEKQLLNLVNEILDLSKLDSNLLELKERVVNLYDFLEPLISQFKSYGDSENINFSFINELKRPYLTSIDTDKFTKIINNFLSNALKFTPKNGTVNLRLVEKNTTFLIIVKDSGSGIHPDDLPNIFNRFYQSKQPDAIIQGGTGIGLSLCKELAEVLNGRVWAESELGKGSIFYFEFPKNEATVPLSIIESQQPIEKKEETETSTIPFRAPFENTTEKTTILIVEDNRELRNYLKSITEEKYEVLTAENGKVALEILAKQPVDFIISDLMMPIVDGFQLLEAVKRKDHLRHLPVIMLTARADVKVKLRALRIGVDDYIVKPFQEEELLLRIANLLQNYRVRTSLTQAIKPTLEKDKFLTPMISEEDLEWLESTEVIVLKYLNDYRLNIDFLVEQLAVSRSTFKRKIKQLTGLSANEYLNEIRFNKARELMETGVITSVKAAAGEVGMKDVKYFSKQFKNRFGKSPSAYF